MYNKYGGKVRLTFKLELDQLWIGTKGIWNSLLPFFPLTWQKRNKRSALNECKPKSNCWAATVAYCELYAHGKSSLIFVLLMLPRLWVVNVLHWHPNSQALYYTEKFLIIVFFSSHVCLQASWTQTFIPGSKLAPEFKLSFVWIFYSIKSYLLSFFFHTERTEKIPMGSIKNVISEPIEDHDEYHMMVR